LFRSKPIIAFLYQQHYMAAKSLPLQSHLSLYEGRYHAFLPSFHLETKRPSNVSLKAHMF